MKFVFAFDENTLKSPKCKTDVRIFPVTLQPLPAITLIYYYQLTICMHNLNHGKI